MKSRRIFKIILITAVLVIVLSIPAFATAKNGVVKSQANVRSGPGRSYSLVYENLPANTQIIIIDRVKCNDGTTSKDWYRVEFNYGGKFYENCYISTGLVTVTSDSGISDEAPELYKSYIDNLKKAHSNWNFKFLYTGLSWDEVLENENVSGRSALQVPPYDKKYLSTTDKTYNPSTGTWTPIDGKTWFQASSDVVSYYLDPRNFLTKESDIFQFETLSYDKNAQTLSGVESMLKGTFMEDSKISTGEKENVGGSCDLNSDNKTDIADAMMLFQYSAGNLADLGSGKDIADLNGDGVVDSNDRTIIGRGLPIHTGGFTNNFEYKGIDLSVFFQWSYGNDIMNANRLFFESSNNRSRELNQFASYANRWTPENPTSDIPAATNSSSNRVISSRIIEDGSYLRLKNATVSYTFDLRKKTRLLRDITLAVTGENLWLWTKYNGFDPDVSSEGTSSTLRRVDMGAYTRSRMFVFSIHMRY